MDGKGEMRGELRHGCWGMDAPAEYNGLTAVRLFLVVIRRKPRVELSLIVVGGKVAVALLRLKDRRTNGAPDAPTAVSERRRRRIETPRRSPAAADQN